MLPDRETDAIMEAVIEKAHKIVKELINSHCTADYFKGATDTIKAMLSIPKTLATTEDERKVADLYVKKAFRSFETRLLRGILLEPDHPGKGEKAR